MRGVASTNRSTRAAGASGGGTPYRWEFPLRRSPRREKGFERFERRAQLVALNGTGRIDVLGTDLRAFADKGAPPDTLMVREDLEPLARALVARIQVVPLGEGDGGRADELGIEAVDRARRIAQHAVDAHAELLVLVHLLWRLAVFALRQRLLELAHDPRLDGDELPHEVADVDDEVADDGKVGERLDADRRRRVVGQERGAGQLRLSVDHHAAAPADAHA